MNLLLIILSSGGGWEMVFIGALIGLAMWGFVSLDSKMRATKQLKKAEKLDILFNQKITSRGGLLVLFNDLFNYLKTKLSIDEFVDDGNVVEYLRNTLYTNEYIDKGNIIVGSNENFLIVVVIKGNSFDTLKVVIHNNKNNKRKEWEFDFNVSQQQMIDTIEAYLKSKI